ncbi:MAG: hypothetical protein KME45_24305 [Stenomitos rutilans HA7619-LM2]|jgi:hypothetical protein|nr:hypothetical protein [Stenomitos rutilans HA7619-LM2]
MTSDHSQKDKPVFQTPNPTELKAAAVEDSILDRYPHGVDNDINEEHPEAEQVDVVDSKVDDRPGAEESHNSQTVKANLSGH